MSNTQIIEIVVLVAAVVAAYTLGATQAEIRALRDQLGRKRHTYPTQNGIEDATAVLIELILNEQANRQYTETRLNQAREILGMVRQGPNEYDSERPNGKAKQN